MTDTSLRVDPRLLPEADMSARSLKVLNFGPSNPETRFHAVMRLVGATLVLVDGNTSLDFSLNADAAPTAEAQLWLPNKLDGQWFVVGRYRPEKTRSAAENNGSLLHEVAHALCGPRGFGDELAAGVIETEILLARLVGDIALRRSVRQQHVEVYQWGWLKSHPKTFSEWRRRIGRDRWRNRMLRAWKRIKARAGDRLAKSSLFKPPARRLTRWFELLEKHALTIEKPVATNGACTTKSKSARTSSKGSTTKTARPSKF